MTLRRIIIKNIIRAAIISVIISAIFAAAMVLRINYTNNNIESSDNPYNGEMHITKGVDPVSVNRVALGEYLFKLPEGLSGQARVNKSFGDVIELPMSEPLYKQFHADVKEPYELSFTFKGVKESSSQPNDILWLFTDGKTQLCIGCFKQRHNAEGDLVFYHEEHLSELLGNCALYIHAFIFSFILFFILFFLILFCEDYISYRKIFFLILFCYDYISHRKKQR